MSVPSVNQLKEIYDVWADKPTGSYWTNQKNVPTINPSNDYCILGGWSGDGDYTCPDCSLEDTYVHDLNGNVVRDNNNKILKRDCGGGVNLTVDFDNGYVSSAPYSQERGKVYPIKVLCIK